MGSTPMYCPYLYHTLVKNMKKTVKNIVVILLTVVMIVSCITTVFAATIYYYFGYYYTYINNEIVSLYGVDSGTNDLFVPDTINQRKLVDIRNSAFLNNVELTQMEFDGATNLERIGSFAFAGCTNIGGEIRIPSNIVLIEVGAFESCSSLQSVILNAAIDTIPNQCFNGCTSLNNIVLNGNIKSIGDYAFADCSSLTYIEIPKSVTEISSVAFQNDSVTLGVYTNSAAHQFAVDNGYEFVLLDAPEPTEPPTDAPTEAPTEAPTQVPTSEPTQPVTEAPTQAPVAILGDVDGDGSVSTIDATVMQRYLASVAYPAGCNFTYGDVDGEGVISILDVTYIMRYLAGIDVPYPVNEPIHNQ